MTLDEIFLYRITHIGNVPHILKHGITRRESPNANPDYIAIGDVSLIATRSQRYVSVNNGDYTHRSAPMILLGDYIPFYFGVRMPMLYVAQKGGNFVERATPATDIIYLAITLRCIWESDMDFYFSDGHATDGLTTFYDSSRLKDLPTIVDWSAVKAQYWGGDDNLNIKRKKQAELLVSGSIPAEHVVRFGCYDEPAKARLVAMGVKEEQVKVIPNAYY